MSQSKDLQHMRDLVGDVGLAFRGAGRSQHDAAHVVRAELTDQYYHKRQLLHKTDKEREDWNSHS